MRGLIVAFAACMLFTVACSGGRSDSPESIPCTNDGTTQAVRTQVMDDDPERLATHIAEGTPRPIEVADDEISCRIRKALLTLTEMPSGWSDPLAGELLVGEDRIYRDSDSQCHVPYAQVSDAVHVSFAMGISTPQPERTPGSSDFAYIDEAILVFSPGAATQFMAAERRACGFGTGQSQSAIGTHTIPLPSIGDEQLGYTYGQPGASGRADSYALIRRGDIVESYLITSRPSKLDEIRAIIRRADAKISRDASYLQSTAVAGVATATATPLAGSEEAILDSALPDSSDMPPHWIPGRSNSKYVVDDLRFCVGAPQLPTREHDASAFYQGSGVSVARASMGVGITEYHTQDADVVMRDVSDGTLFHDGCAGSVLDYAVMWNVARLDVSDLGEISSAWRAVAHQTALRTPGVGLTSDIEFDFVVFRRGNLIALLYEAADAPPAYDPTRSLGVEAATDLEAFGKLVDAKLKTIESKVPPG